MTREQESPGKDYRVQAVIRALAMVEFLAGGEIDAWKTIREVSGATGIRENTCYRLLETLVAVNWAEKSPKGYRQSSAGLIRHAIYARDYYKKLGENCG